MNRKMQITLSKPGSCAKILIGQKQVWSRKRLIIDINHGVMSIYQTALED